MNRVQARKQVAVPGGKRAVRPWLVGLCTLLALLGVGGYYYYSFFLRAPASPSVLFHDAQQIADLQILTRDEPNNPEWHVRLANAYVTEGHFLSAIDSLKTALRLGGDEEAVLRRLGVCYTQVGQHDLTLAAAKRIRELSPDTLGPILAVAHAHMDVGEFDEARQVILGVQVDEQGRPLIGSKSPEEREQESIERRQRLAGTTTPPAAGAEEEDPALQRQALLSALDRLGDYERSLQLARKAIRHSPSRLGGYVAAGKALMALGRAGEAVEFFKPVPLSPEFRYLEAMCLLSRGGPGDEERAEKELEEAVRRQPDHGRAWWELAHLRAAHGEWASASAAYAGAHQYGVERPRALKLAIAMAEKGKQAEVAETLRAAYYQQTGLPEKALQIYRKRFEQQPEQERALDYVVGALRALGRHEERLDLLLEAQQRFPQSARIVTSISQTYADLDRAEESIAVLREAARGFGKNDAGLLNALGIRVNDAGLLDEAESIFRRIVPLLSDQAAPRYSLARLLLMDRGDAKKLAEAVTLLEACVVLQRNDAEIHRVLGRAYVHAGRDQEAIWTLRHAIDLEPGEGNTYQTLGDLLSRTDHPEEAKWMLALAERYRHYRRTLDVVKGRARRKTPELEDLRALADFYYQNQSYEQAEPAYLKVLDRSPEDQQARRRLADIYGKAGRTADQSEMLARLRTTESR